MAAKGKAAPKRRFKAGLIRGTASAGGVVEDPIRDFSQTPVGVGDGEVTAVASQLATVMMSCIPCCAARRSHMSGVIAGR